MVAGIEVIVLARETGSMMKEIIYGRCGLSRGLLRRMKSGGGVFLNDRPAYITQRVQAGDRIWLEFADSPTALPAEKMPLQILYEDEWLLVVDKPPCIAVHPTGRFTDGTLVNGLAYHWESIGLRSKVRLVHRLDYETSGTVLVAKEPFTHRKLIEQLAAGSLRRHYLAAVTGSLPAAAGVINAPIGRSTDPEEPPLKRIVRTDGKVAVTRYRVLRDYRTFALVEMCLETGRTHQIRVHLETVGCALVGDELYGVRSPMIGRQALHAWFIEFEHPRTERLVKVRSVLPVDMRALLRAESRKG